MKLQEPKIEKSSLKRFLPHFEINDAHSRWNYHRIWETGNKKNGQDEEDKLGGNFICLLALPEKLDHHHKKTWGSLGS